MTAALTSGNVILESILVMRAVVRLSRFYDTKPKVKC